MIKSINSSLIIAMTAGQGQKKEKEKEKAVRLIEPRLMPATDLPERACVRPNLGSPFPHRYVALPITLLRQVGSTGYGEG